MTPTWLKGTLLLLCVFLVGGAAGFAVGRMHQTRTMTTNPMEPHAFVDRLGSDLRLDTAQRAAILAIMTRRQSTIDSAWRALQPSVRATVDSAQMDIVRALRPDQRARYLQLVQAAHGNR